VHRLVENGRLGIVVEMAEVIGAGQLREIAAAFRPGVEVVRYLQFSGNGYGLGHRPAIDQGLKRGRTLQQIPFCGRHGAVATIANEPC
jgi:hypothetical protein